MEILLLIIFILGSIGFGIGLMSNDDDLLVPCFMVGIVSLTALVLIYSSKTTEVKSNNTIKQDSIWITAHDGKQSIYSPQTIMNEVPMIDSLGEEILLIKVRLNKTK